MLKMSYAALLDLNTRVPLKHSIAGGGNNNINNINNNNNNDNNNF